MIAQWLTERVEYSFGGKTWALIFTHRALLLCQQATGMDTLAVTLKDPSSRLLRGLLFGALSAAGCECSIEDLGRDFKPRRIPAIRSVLIKAWIACMADPKREPYRPPPKPTKKPPDKPSWIRKWAYETSVDGLGIPEYRWLDMTPRMIQELEILKLHQMQREEYLTGIVAAQVENYSPVHPKETALPERFMLHLMDPEEDEDDALSVGDKIWKYYSQFPAQGDAGPAPPPEARVPIILGAPPAKDLLVQ